MWVRLSPEELEREARERVTAGARIGPPLLQALLFTGLVMLMLATGFSPRRLAFLPRGPLSSELSRAAYIAPIILAGVFWTLFRRRSRGAGAPEPTAERLLCPACFEAADAAGGVACACGGVREPIERFVWRESAAAESAPAAAASPSAAAPAPLLAATGNRRIAMALSAVAAVGGSLLLWPLRTAGREPAPAGFAAIAPSDDASTIMRKLAHQCTIDARERHGIELDYSPESVADVERILASLAPMARSMEPRDVGAIAMVHGAYLGEVIRREKGGSWERDHEAAGPGSFPLLWSGHASFPYGWCRKRLLGGDEENVLAKYALFVHDQKLPGRTYEQETIPAPGAPR